MKPYSLLLLFCSLCLCFGACKKDSGGAGGTTPAQARPAKRESPVTLGQRLYVTKGCMACHTKDGKKSTAPTFKGLYGSKRTVITKGKTHTVTADDAYIIRSIQKPKADIVKGYEKVLMVTVPISNEEAVALTAYIKSLK